jgi:hypothetical protein
MRIITTFSAMVALLGWGSLATHASSAFATSGRHAAPSSARERLLRAYRDDRALSERGGRRRAARAQTAIVGGTQASIEQVPWQVAVFALFEADGKKGALLCGGSILDMSHLLTAAHCAFNPATGARLSPESFVVVAGASSLTSEEIKNGPTVEARFVSGVRVHPDFDYQAGPGTPDDVAVLEVEPLRASTAVSAIGLPSSTTSPPEGTAVTLSGFGEESASSEEFDEQLHTLGMTLQFSRKCGGETDALFLCASALGGSACFADSGGGVVGGSQATLVGMIDIVEVVSDEPCERDALNGFVNLAAPEVRDFIEGSEDPPLAPRGGGVSIKGVTTAGHSLSCEPGTWSGDPTFTYLFVDGAGQQVLQQGASATYALSEADVGRTIRCEVEAANAGGTGIARTEALAAIAPALTSAVPPSGSSGGGSATGSTPVVGSSTPSTSESSGSAKGGVLAFTQAGVGSAQIAALLGRELAPKGGAKLAAVRKRDGYTVAVKALAAGVVAIDWHLQSAGANAASKHGSKSVLVASGRATFAAKGTKKVDVKLTPAGVRLLGRADALKLTATGTFTPSGGTSVVVTKAFVLER